MGDPRHIHIHILRCTMILVIGNDPQRVELSDLGDTVYFKQQKFFSDSQCARSVDLRRAIKAGKVTVLQKYGNVDQEFVIPSQGTAKPAQADSSKMDLLLDKIGALEKSLSAQAPARSEGSVMELLLSRISKIEERLSGMPQGSADASTAEALRDLAKKIESGSKDTVILNRLESILKEAGSGQAPREPTRPEDVYVPNVSVEDGNTHIKLDVRPVQAPSGDLDASLEALRKLKSQR